MKIAWTNWRTAAVASGLCIVLIVIIAALSASPSDDTLLRRPSTFFTDQSGARAIYLVLQQVLPSAEQWRFPFTELERPSNSGLLTLIVMGPMTQLGQTEAAALDAWIESGGQLILASRPGWPMQKRTGDAFAKNYLDRHDLYRHGGLKGATALAQTQMKSVGKGRIIYVPDNYAFSNETLRTSDDAVWLAERSAEWGGAVGFDEYHHGFGLQRGLLPVAATFAATPWGLLCLQLALAAALYLFGFKRRFGKPLDELPVERTNPIETVHAIGGLFEAAHARALSARVIHQHLNACLSSKVGYRVDLLNPQVRQRLASPSRTERAELDAYAEAVANTIQGHRTSDEAVIGIGRKANAIARSFSHGAANKRPSAAS